MGYILNTIRAMGQDSSVGEIIPDLDQLPEKDLKNAGITTDIKKELIDSQSKCNQILNAVYRKIASKITGIKEKLRNDEENIQEYGVADKTDTIKTKKAKELEEK